MPTIMLSEHFSLQEFLYSQTASRAGIKNVPTLEAALHLYKTAHAMELVRGICVSCPVIITSGYRNEQVNALVGGATNSAHMSGLAADFIIPEFGDPYDVCMALQPYMTRLKIDQLIWEYGDWVHIAFVKHNETPRCQCLTINEKGTQDGFVQ